MPSERPRDLNKTIERCEKLVRTHPPEHPAHIFALQGIVDCLSHRFDRSRDPADLDRAVELCERVIEICAQDEPGLAADRRRARYYLADVLRKRYDVRKRMKDLARAVDVCRQNVASTPPGYDSTQLGLDDCLFQLATLLRTRLFAKRKLSDLEEIVRLLRQCVDIVPPDSDARATAEDHLADALTVRFENKKCQSDIDEAVDLRRQVLAYRTPRNTPGHLRQLWNATRDLFTSSAQRVARGDVLGRSAPLRSLAITLLVRFDEARDLSDVDEAIDALRQAAKLHSPFKDDAQADCLARLAEAYALRFKTSRLLSDMDHAVDFARSVLKLPHSLDESVTLSLARYAEVVHERYLVTKSLGDLRDVMASLKSIGMLFRFNAPSDLTRYVELLERVLESQTEGEPSLLHIVDQFAAILEKRYSSNSTTDKVIDAVIRLRERALGLSSLGTHNEAFGTARLSRAFGIRYLYGPSRRYIDLDKAIELAERALELDPSDSNTTAFLALYLTTRFDIAKSVEDLDRAIALHHQLLVFHPSGSKEHVATLKDLSLCFMTRFPHTDDLEDVDNAIKVLDQALALATPDDKGYYEPFERLATAYGLRFDVTKDKRDLDNAIEQFELAAAIAPQDHTYISHVAHSHFLRRRYKHFKDAADLDRAIWALERTLSYSVDVSKAEIYSRLGACKLARASGAASHERDAAFADLERSVRIEDGDVRPRFLAALKWAKHATRAVNERPWTEAAQAYERAIELLPQLLLVRLDAAGRLEMLGRTQTLACDAAAWWLRHAARDSPAARAVELLEQGRAAFWAQALQLRTAFDDDEELGLPDDEAMELKRISEELLASAALPPPAGGISSAEIHRRRRLQTEWVEAVKRVRAKEGFEHFLLPKPYAQLAECARNGPVVVLVGSVHLCAALAILPGRVEPVHVSFEGFGFETARKLGEKMFGALGSLGVYRNQAVGGDGGQQEEKDGAIVDRFGRPAGVIAPSDVLQSVLDSLWKMVVQPVYAALEANGIREGRIWWCPSGPFTHLPLHAAAPLSSRFTPSYTYTLDALIKAYKAAPARSPSSSDAPEQPIMTGVAVTSVSSSHPRVRDLRRLPYVQRELDAVASAVGEQRLRRLTDAQATVSAVMEQMAAPASEWLHFACHAQQDAREPLRSGLELFDGRLELGQIIGVNRSVYPTRGPKFVFLSACETARGDARLVNEAVHLVGAFVAAGFRGAVGTLWSMADLDGPQVARGVYREVFGVEVEAGAERGGGPDASRAAEGLHRAVKRMREGNVPHHQWIPFIHVGV